MGAKKIDKQFALFAFTSIFSLLFVAFFLLPSSLLASPPSAVTAFTAAQSDQILLSWTVSSGAPTSFLIRYSTTGPILRELDFSTATFYSTQTVTIAEGKTQTLMVTGLVPVTKYWWIIKSTNVDGGIEISTEGPQTPSPSATTPQNVLTSSFTVLPSPDHSPFTGFKANYYSDPSFSSFVFSRTDQNINFNWCGDPLPPGTNQTNFSAVWTATVWVDRPSSTFTISNVFGYGLLSINSKKSVETYGANTSSMTFDVGKVRNFMVEYSKSGGSCGGGGGPRISVDYVPTIKGLDEWIYQGGIGAFAKLKFSVNHEFTVVDKIKIQRTGNSVAGDVESVLENGVKIYRDSNGTGLLEAGDNDFSLYGSTDQLIGSGTINPASDDCDIDVRDHNGNGITVLSSSPVTLLLVYKMNVNAVHGHDIGMKLQDSGNLTRDAASLTKTSLSAAGYPFTSSTFSIRATNDLLYNGAASMNPAVVTQGATNFVFINLPVWSDKNGLDWTGLNVERTGTGSDSDFTAIKVYKDNGNQTLDGNDELISSGLNTFTGSVASITFLTPRTIAQTTQYYFVAADVSAFAAVGKLTGLRLASTQSFVVASPDEVLNAGFPFNTSLSIMQEYADTVQITTISYLLSSTLNQSQSNAGVMKMLLKTGFSTADWTRLRMDKMGTIANGDILSLKIYRDANGNGTFEAGMDTLVSTGTNVFNGSGIAYIQISTQTLLPTAATYFISVDVASNAVPFTTFGLSVANTSYFTIASPNVMSGNLLPSSCTLATVQEPPTYLQVTGTNISPLTANQAQQSVGMLRLDLIMQRYTSQWTALKVVRTGTSGDSDVSRISLYKDFNNSGAFEALSDQEISTASFSQGIAYFSGFSKTLDAAATQVYFVVFDISPSASQGVTVGARISNSNFITLTSPDQALSSCFPIETSSTTLVATSDGLLVTGVDEGLVSIYQGSTAPIFATLTLAATDHSVLWSGLTVNKTGTIADGDIKAVRIFEDTSGDGSFQSASDKEVTSGQNMFGGGVCNILFPNAITISTTAKKYFIGLDTLPNAKIGDSIGLAISTVGYFSVQPPDYVLPAGFPITSSLPTILDQPDSVRLSTTSLSAATIYQGARNEPIIKLAVSVAEDQANWTALRIDKAGTLSDTAIQAVKLYRDFNSNGQLDASTDTLVASGLFTGGVVQLGFNAQSITTAPVSYFIAMDLIDDSPVDATIGVRIVNEGYLTVAAPDTAASFASFSSSLGRIIDKRTPTQPVVAMGEKYTSAFNSLKFSWQSSVPSGVIAEIMYAIGTSTNSFDVKGWTSVTTPGTDITVSGITLQSGRTYFVSVLAKSTYGIWSSTGSSASGTTVDLEKPQVTSAPDAMIQGDTFVLTWAVSRSPVSGVAGYIVEEKPGNKPVFKTFDPGSQASGAHIFATPFAGSFAPTVSSNAVVISGKSAGTYYYRVRPVSASGVTGDPSPSVRVDFKLSELDAISSISNYPNPFDSRKQRTTLTYTLKEDRGVNLKIYDAFGGKVLDTFFEAGVEGGKAGSNQVEWDGTDNGGRKVAQGVYYAITDVSGEETSGSTAKKPLVIGVIH